MYFSTEVYTVMYTAVNGTANQGQNGRPTLVHNLAGPQMVEYRVTSNSTPRNSPERTENICPQKLLLVNIHSSIIYSSRKAEITQMFLG